MTKPLPTPLASWLRRANQHPFRSRLLLSGSTLIAAICPQARTPNDLDYVVTGTYDAEIMTRLIHDVVATPDTRHQLSVQQIEEVFEYTEKFPGIRAELVTLEDPQIQHSFKVDFAFGDPLTTPPRPIVIPDVGSVLAVAPESLFAWKMHALIQFGYSWRPKDAYDLRILWTAGRLNRQVLPEAIDIAFSSRDSELAELDEFLADDEAAWGKYNEERWNDFTKSYNVQLTFHDIRAELRAMLGQIM